MKEMMCPLGEDRANKSKFQYKLLNLMVLFYGEKGRIDELN